MRSSGPEELIGVAFVRDRLEAEMIQGLLRTADIPSFVKRVGIDGPQLGFGLLSRGGSQQVMVRSDQAEAARALLTEAEVVPEPESWAESEPSESEEATGRGPRTYNVFGAYARAYVWSAIAFALAFGAFALSQAI
jgi:Putative prokaryotic signal transducing protein